MTRPAVLEPEAAYALWAASYPAHAHNPVMQAEERAMLALLPGDLREQAVLDAGCGSGRYLLHAARRGATRLTGVDLSLPMLERAYDELAQVRLDAELTLLRGSVVELPVEDARADLTISGLVLGHIDDLPRALAELRRATKPGGTLLCSDFHPTGHALGWLRDFKANGQRYAARHTPHLYSHWHRACAALDLAIEEVREPMLDPADIPAGARFDPIALDVPVALVFRLRRY